MKTLRESLLDDDLIGKTDKIIKDEIKAFLIENYKGLMKIIIVLYVVRWCLQRGKPTEYDILGQNELEVQPASINPSEPKFEIDESNEDNNLVDYEISTIPKKKEEEKVY